MRLRHHELVSTVLISCALACNQSVASTEDPIEIEWSKSTLLHINCAEFIDTGELLAQEAPGPAELIIWLLEADEMCSHSYSIHTFPEAIPARHACNIMEVEPTDSVFISFTSSPYEYIYHDCRFIYFF